MDGIVQFSNLVVDGIITQTKDYPITAGQQYVDSELKRIFMSHKTGDTAAESEAKRITKTHRVIVYMAEWDPGVTPSSNKLPDYLLRHIHISHGFLVHVSRPISISMWVGYEIGGAHAFGVKRARVEKSSAGLLPTVLSALEKLSNNYEVDQWIRTHVT